MFKRKSLYILFILCMLAAFSFKPVRAFLYKITADFFFPFVNMTSVVDYSIQKQQFLSKSKRALANELVRQQQINEELASRCAYLEQFKVENNELRKFLRMKQRGGGDFKYISAEIVNRDPSKWYSQFILNKGSLDGISDGAVVIARIKNSNGIDKDFEYGVVGRIGFTSKHTSVVHTLLSSDCQLSVKIPETGAVGILQGGERRGRELWAYINYLPRDFIYNDGSIVKTSGLTNLTPPNITVGTLIVEKPNDISITDNLYAIAKVRPAVNLNYLNFVLVLVEKK